MNPAVQAAYQRYILAVSAVLTDYQYIEEGLRMYAANSYELIRAKLGNDMPFKYSYADTEKDALGKLISRFEKLSSRDDLTKALKDLVKDRNIVAHQAFLLLEEQYNYAKDLDLRAEGLGDLRKRTKPLVESILLEANRLEGLVKASKK